MKGSEQRLVEYMDGAKTKFVIPVYQRNYDWRMETTSSKFFRNGRKSYFFGCISLVHNPDGCNFECIFVIIINYNQVKMCQKN